MMNLIRAVLVLSIVAACATAFSEEIKNDSGCDVCPGAVCFSAEESTDILGEELKNYVNQWQWQGIKGVWMDLDGAFKDTEAPANETQFELKIFGRTGSMVITSLVDGSHLKLSCYSQEDLPAVAAGGNADWAPEIYLFGSESRPIDLKDPLDAGWEKLEETHIYQWVSQGKDLKNNPGIMKAQVYRALAALAPVKVTLTHSD